MYQPVPEHFWRTLVADRGRLSATPPKYFSRACQDAFSSAFHTGYLRPADYISHGHSSVLAEFCRRVEVVVFNRALIKTKAGRLGLVSKGIKKGDKVCILYGCSVPVILRKFEKKTEEFEHERDLKRREKLKKWEYHASNFRKAIRRRKERREELEQQGFSPRSPKTPKTHSFPVITLQEKPEKPATPAKPKRLSSSPMNGEAWTPGTRSPGKCPTLDAVQGPLRRTKSQPQTESEKDIAGIDLDKYDADPFSALTPTRHFYFFEGECYIHGMMDGQAIQFKNAEKIENTLFELR
jgi:hypothetical protein